MNPRRGWPALLPDAPPWLDAVTTTAVVGLLVWSRFGLLASGPWEWDETLFARGLMHFELAAHFPHPPGFPGWMAIGHLLLPFVSEPLRGLQIASAALSILALWPLAVLGRRVAPAAVALAGALLVLLAPGPWLHAVRGFSSTPAAFFLLLAAAGLTVERPALRPTAVTLAIAASVLVRPQLLPVATILWLALALRVGSLRRLAPGIVLSVGAGLVSIVLMARAEGGWVALVSAFADHAGRHFSRLAANGGTLAELGIVTSLGGPAGFLTVAVLGTLGLLAWGRRRGRTEGATALLVILAVLTELLMLQNRTYPRYAVPFVLACGPLVAAGAAAVAPPALATVGLAGLAAWQAAAAYPLLVEQHTERLPGWAAVLTGSRIAGRHGMDAVVEAGLYPFASYRWYLLGGGRQAAEPHLVLSPWAPEPWTGIVRPYVVITDTPDRYLGPLVRGTIRFDGVSPELQRLTQKRFLEAAVLIDPPLPLGTWWPVEVNRRGERFMWGSTDAAIELPPLPPGTRLLLRLLPARGPEPLTVTVDGQPLAVLDGEGGRRTVSIPSERLRPGTPHRIAFPRKRAYPPGPEDSRPLSVRLEAIQAMGPWLPWSVDCWDREERARLGVRIQGGYAPERFGPVTRGLWLRPHATLSVPAGGGTLRLVLLAPRPVGSATTIRIGGRTVLGPVDVPPVPTVFQLHVGAREHPLEPLPVEIDSRPYCPAEAGDGPDTRRLGVVLASIAFEPATDHRWLAPSTNAEAAGTEAR